MLAQALALPFPENGATLKIDTKLQYAGILMEANRFDQAAALYTQILNDDAGNLSAWMGLVSAHHELGQDSAGHRRRGEDAAGDLRSRTRRSRLSLHAGSDLSAGESV